MRSCLLALALLFASATVLAKPNLPGPPVPASAHVPTWAELSPAQQADLAKLEQRWDRMPRERRAQILHRLERWRQLRR